MRTILKSPMGTIENSSFLIEKWKDMVRRQDERTGRQALADDTKRTIMMDMCPMELDRHLVPNSGRYVTYPKGKAAVRDYLEQMRDKSDPMEVGEMSDAADEVHEDGWEEVQAVARAHGKSEGNGKSAGKDGKGMGKSSGKGKTWQEDPDKFPYTCHNCGEKGCDAAQCGKEYR